MAFSRSYFWVLTYIRATLEVGAHGIGVGSESRALDFAYEHSPNEADSFLLEAYPSKGESKVVKKIRRRL